jgi:hypothetical protein
MSRTRLSAKAAGSRFERAVADYMSSNIDDRIDRKVKTGAADKGDVGGVRLSPALRGGKVTVECKDYGGRLLPSAWLAEAEIERGNDDGVVGVVVAKRRGVADPADQFVLMTLRDLCALLTGIRPAEAA